MDSSTDYFYHCIIHFNCPAIKCKDCEENNVPPQEKPVKYILNKSPRNKSPTNSKTRERSTTPISRNNNQNIKEELTLRTNFSKAKNNKNNSFIINKTMSSKEINNLKEEYENKITDYLNLINEYEKELRDQESEIKDKDMQIEYLQRMIEDKDSQVEIMKDNIKNNNKLLQEKENQLNKLKNNEIKTENNLVKKLQTNNEKLTNENTDLRIKYSLHLNQIENLQQMLKDKDNMLNNQMNLLNNLSNNQRGNINMVCEDIHNRNRFMNSNNPNHTSSWPNGYGNTNTNLMNNNGNYGM